jgi:hypothetical protein
MLQLRLAAHRYASLIPIGRSLGSFSRNYNTIESCTIGTI